MVWSYGDTVLYRYGRQGQTRFVRVGRVIADDADGLALWIGAGSPQIESVLADGRGLRGVDTTDRALDVWITPDRVGRWKDEDEFAALTGLPGRWTADQAPAIRATGEHLMDLAASGAPPFDGRWTDYRPDRGWEPLSLPDGWDQPHRATP